MATKKDQAAAQAAASADDNVAKQTVVICDVCGHGNPEGVGLCAMCSNYLFETGVKKDGNNK